MAGYGWTRGCASPHGRTRGRLPPRAELAPCCCSPPATAQSLASLSLSRASSTLACADRTHRLMRRLAVRFDNPNLDPSLWASRIAAWYNQLCRENPGGFVLIDMSLFALFVVLFLFEADLRKWWRERNLRAQGDETGGEAATGLSKFSAMSALLKDPEAMQTKLRTSREELEEVDLLLQLRAESEDAAMKRELATMRSMLGDRIDMLNSFLSAMESEKAESVDLEAAAKEAEEAEARKRREGGCGEMTKLAVTILRNTISGVLTIYLYFMDLITDFQVIPPPPPHTPDPCAYIPCAHTPSPCKPPPPPQSSPRPIPHSAPRTISSAGLGLYVFCTTDPIDNGSIWTTL